MSIQTFVVLMAIAILAMAWYANTSKRNKILCTFRRVNKTKIVRFVSMQDEFIIFDKKKYDIIPSRITFQWYTGGLIHMIFPQWIATLDYTYGKRLPLDPNKMNYDWDNPATRKAINISEIVKSYFNTANPSPSTKKQSMLLQYLPWIAILLVAVIGFYLYNNMQGISEQMAIMQNQFNAITK